MSVRRWVCRRFGHKWDARIDACSRCDMTTETIRAGRDKQPTWGDVDNAYRAGLENGRAFERAYVADRAYVLGRLRGSRLAVMDMREGVGLSAWEKQ